MHTVIGCWRHHYMWTLKLALARVDMHHTFGDLFPLQLRGQGDRYILLYEGHLHIRGQYFVISVL